ncbi:MAG: hypothetical protein WC466_01385 [Candidatus Izemoplasmatales bacterium]
MKIKIGLVGTSQLSFPGPKAAEYAKAVQGMQQHSETMGFDFVYYPDQVITEIDAIQAINMLEKEHIDFLMILNISYSAGFLVPIFYRIQNAKVGIWSIPETPEGPVLFNSFCSNNMYQAINRNYMRDYHIQSKWFFGHATDPSFIDRLKVTVRALQAIKKLKNSRIALIGGIAPGFYDLYFDERSLFSKLDGIYFNRNHEYQEIINLANQFTDHDIDPFMESFNQAKISATNRARNLLGFSYKIYLAYKKLISENHYDAIAVSCWPKFQDDYEYSVCSVMGMLNDDRIVAACEGDVMSAVSMLALQEISQDSTSLMDFTAFDETDETIMLWHCGPGAQRFCQRNGYTLGENYSGMAHKDGEICGTGVVRDMEFDQLPITSFRFSGDMERYINLTGQFIGNKKKSNKGSRGWLGNVKLNNQNISVLDFANTILSSGFEHHYPIAIGDYAKEIKEMNKWLGIKPITRIPYDDCLQDEEDQE